MKKILFIIGMIFLINNVSALTNIPNDNTTSKMIYESQIVDTNYILNSTDSLSYFKIDYELLRSEQPYTITYVFKDKRNNTFVFSDLYVFNNRFGIIPFITRTRTAYLNNVPQIFTPPTLLNGNASKLGYQLLYNYSEDFNIIDVFSSTSSFNDKIEFSTNMILYDKPLLGENTYKNILNTKLFINEIILPNSSRITYTNIHLEYNDNSIAFINSQISDAYNELNPIFRFIFLFLKALTSFFSMLSLISDAQFYEFQFYFISPLSFIDMLLKTFFSILKFIFMMGIAFTFIVPECLIFVYNWIKTGDIFQTFDNTIRDSIAFWNIIIIKPLGWIYTKLMLFWTSR